MLAKVMQTQENNHQDTRFLSGRILIVGLGVTGLSCARFLHTQGAKDVSIIDSRRNPPGMAELKKELPEIEVFAGRFDPDVFSKAETLVVSPGVSIREPMIVEARKRGCTILGDIEIFARFAKAPVVSITGSNGKSTVTTLLTKMAEDAGVKVSMGGNIGTPALNLIHDGVELYVLELSSFQLETTSSLNSTTSVILNISEDHMDRYSSLAEYTAAKTRVYLGMGDLVVNRDDASVKNTGSLLSKDRTIIGFTLHQPEPNDFGIHERNGIRWLSHGDNFLLEESALKIKGKHNTANALAALALGYHLDLSMNDMIQTLKNFTGLDHRCQWVGEHKGVAWFNDSKATNVGAAVAAIKGLDANKIVLIAGGQGKAQDFQLLRHAVEASCRCVILMGEDAKLLAKALGEKVEIIFVSDLEQAVKRASDLACSGDAVLLSPACASFDMFTSYVERGNLFVSTVKRLCL